MKTLTEQIANHNKQLRYDDNLTVEQAEGLSHILEGMSDHDLIRVHTEITRMVGNAQHELTMLESAIETRFPAEKTTEQIVTPYGIAERKVTNTYVPNAELMDEAKEELGPYWSEYFTEKDAYKVDPTKVDDLLTRLGSDADHYFMRTVRYSATRKAADAVRTGEGDAADVKYLTGIIDVVQKISLKITPVSDGEVKKAA